MEYFSITVKTTSIASELIADIFLDISGQGVSIMDSSDIKALYKDDIVWDYIEEKLLVESEVVTVTGYTTKDSLNDTLKRLDKGLEELKRNSTFLLGSLEITTQKLDQEDWSNEWKRHYSPIELDKIVVVPQWHTFDTQKAVVKIDPGMAFGTGEHESTKMCLQLLEKLSLKDKSILDIGCGSGILGIAALKLGASNCYFSDIDSAALDNMQKNAKINDIEDKVIVEQASLVEGKLCKKGDVLLANITADILILLAEKLKKCLNYNASIIISGIIKEREDEVLSSFLQKGVILTARQAINDWVAFGFSYGA